MNALSLTALYTFVCALFFTAPIPKTQEQNITPEIKEIFQAILSNDDLLFFQAIQKSENKHLKLSDGTTPLSFAIEQNQFEYCTELIKEEFLASPQDLIQAKLMYTLESDPIKKEYAKNCINFLEQYLQEQNLIPKTSEIKRGKGCKTEQFQSFTELMTHPDYLLIQATQHNNIRRMEQLIIEQHADPETCINGSTPLSIAITQGFTEAVDYLINQHVAVTIQYTEKARVLMELATSQPDSDLYYPGTKDQATARLQHLHKATYIYTQLLKKLEEIASPQQTPSASPKATPPPTPTRPSSATAGFETPILQRTSNPYRLPAPNRTTQTPTPNPTQAEAKQRISGLPPLAPKISKR